MLEFPTSQALRCAVTVNCFTLSAAGRLRSGFAVSLRCLRGGDSNDKVAPPHWCGTAFKNLCHIILTHARATMCSCKQVLVKASEVFSLRVVEDLCIINVKSTKCWEMPTRGGIVTSDDQVTHNTYTKITCLWVNGHGTQNIPCNCICGPLFVLKKLCPAPASIRQQWEGENAQLWSRISRSVSGCSS